MKELRTHIDGASLSVIAITLALFLIALFVKGLTHDLFLEAGVFLVSVKLVMMAYKNSVATRALTRELSEIRAMLQRLEGVDAHEASKPVVHDSPRP